MSHMRHFPHPSNDPPTEPEDHDTDKTSDTVDDDKHDSSRTGPIAAYPDPADIYKRLCDRKIKAVDPRAPAIWVIPDTKANPFTSDFIREQQIAHRRTCGAMPALIAAKAKYKPKASGMPKAIDIWLVASGYAKPGDRLRVARGMLGWNQTVAALAAGQPSSVLLSQFESGRIENLTSLELVCSAIHVDHEWVRHGGDANMPEWLVPWRQASLEAFALCDQLTRNNPDAYHQIVHERERAAAFNSWLNDASAAVPQRQPWWKDRGSLLPWFADASRHYHLTTTAVDTLQLTDRAIRDLQAIVSDWCVLRGKIEQVPGLADRMRSPGRPLTLQDGKRLEEEFKRVCRFRRVDESSKLPSVDAALDALAQTMFPYPVKNGGSERGTCHRLVVTVDAGRCTPPEEPKSTRGRKKKA